MIPILFNHDQNKVLGYFNDGVVTFINPISYNTVIEVLGHIGFKLLEYSTVEEYPENTLISKLEIMEWSIPHETTTMSNLVVDTRLVT